MDGNKIPFVQGPQDLFILCEKVETPEGFALVRLQGMDVGSQPLVDYAETVNLAHQYWNLKQIPVYILRAVIKGIVTDKDNDYEELIPEFVDVSKSHYKD